MLILREQIVSRENSYFPVGGHSVTQTTKYMKRCKQHNIQHQNMQQLEQQQKNRLGTIINIKLLEGLNRFMLLSMMIH